MTKKRNWEEKSREICCAPRLGLQFQWRIISRRFLTTRELFLRRKDLLWRSLSLSQEERNTGPAPLKEGKADIRVYLLDELLFYFAVIENQGSRRLSIILGGSSTFVPHPAGQSDFKNFRVSRSRLRNVSPGEGSLAERKKTRRRGRGRGRGRRRRKRSGSNSLRFISTKRKFEKNSLVNPPRWCFFSAIGNLHRSINESFPHSLLVLCNLMKLERATGLGGSEGDRGKLTQRNYPNTVYEACHSFQSSILDISLVILAK